MLINTDLHIHSCFSMATSKDMLINNIAIKSKEKGLNLIGTGDALHPKWLEDIKNNTQAVSVLRDMQKEQEKEVEKAKVVQEQKRLKLQNAMQERKTQEKLYENAFEEFVREENARESKEVDELTSYVYGKRTKEEN